MKLAVLLAQTSSGWHLLGAGNDVVQQRQAFKAIKVAGSLVLGDEPASCIVYLDTARDVRRKLLRDPQDAAAQARLEATLAQIARADEEKVAQREAKDKAGHVARKVLDVITESLAAGSVTDPADDRDAALELASQEIESLRAEIDRLRSDLANAASVPATLPATEIPHINKDDSTSAVAEATTSAPAAAGAGVKPADDGSEADEAADHFGAKRKGKKT